MNRASDEQIQEFLLGISHFVPDDGSLDEKMAEEPFISEFLDV
jgi:hypothetical protein